MELKTYTVIGMFAWDRRIAESFEAIDADQAERMFHPDAAYIAGVIEGEHVVDPPKAHTEPREYTVIGYYRDNDQRYGTAVWAHSAAEAETEAIYVCNQDNYPRLPESEYDENIIVVCGVVEGSHECVDGNSDEYGAVRSQMDDPLDDTEEV
jgi:hypothetical protein